jgi:hypothetical protein
LWKSQAEIEVRPSEQRWHVRIVELDSTVRGWSSLASSVTGVRVTIFNALNL